LRRLFIYLSFFLISTSSLYATTLDQESFDILSAQTLDSDVLDWFPLNETKKKCYETKDHEKCFWYTLGLSFRNIRRDESIKILRKQCKENHLLSCSSLSTTLLVKTHYEEAYRAAVKSEKKKTPVIGYNARFFVLYHHINFKHASDLSDLTIRHFKDTFQLGKNICEKKNMACSFVNKFQYLMDELSI